MFKKTLLILAIICLVFNQTFACKKGFKKLSPSASKTSLVSSGSSKSTLSTSLDVDINCSFACKKKIKKIFKKKPKRYQKLSPSPSVSSSASDISYIFRSLQGKITMVTRVSRLLVTLSRYSKTSCKFILNCFRGIITSSDFKTFIF